MKTAATSSPSSTTRGPEAPTRRRGTNTTTTRWAVLPGAGTRGTRRRPKRRVCSPTTAVANWSETSSGPAAAFGYQYDNIGNRKTAREDAEEATAYTTGPLNQYTAIERGYYAEEGLDVKVRFPANANDALALVAAGKAEIGMYYQQDVIQAVANQGTKIKSIGAIVQSPLSIVLSLKDKNITSPSDLVGKTVGYGGTALSESIVKTMMEYVGADASDVNLIDVGFDLMSSMTTGNVDATIGCLVNHEVPQLEEEGFDVNYFMANGYGIPNYYEEVFLANNEMIESEPEVLKGIFYVHLQRALRTLRRIRTAASRSS